MKNKVICLCNTISILLTTALLFTHCNTESPNEGTLEQGFTNPPVENRPLAFWDWLNGYVDTAKLVYELEEMKDKGMQGVFIWDVGALLDPDNMIPTGPAFLGEESLGYISLALRTGGRLGLNLGMIASSSWNAGSDWIEEADASKELLSTNQVVTGPSKKTITIEKPAGRRGEPEKYALISSVAIPYSESKEIDYTSDKTISLDVFTLNNKFIEWEVPEGKWDVISFFMCNTGQNLTCPSPNSNGLMIDHLSRKATKVHFDTILARLEKISNPEYKLKFLEVDSYEVWPAKDWTPVFIQEFETRYGYNPQSFLPLLKDYNSKDIGVGKRFLGDSNTLAGEYHVSINGSNDADGSVAHPFLTISEAVRMARAGDTITVHAGTYREWVDPLSLKRAQDQEGSIYQLYCESDSKTTTIWANFHEFDPNKELVEINVRPAVFYPQKTGIDYITVCGFKLTQAATTWAPPTAEQMGLIGPNWSKGWIIENSWMDLHIEVSHGPHIIDYNLFLSDLNLWNMAVGSAYINNLFAGQICDGGESERFTPYHYPHSTKVAENILYLNGAVSYKNGLDKTVDANFNSTIQIQDKSDGIYLLSKMNNESVNMASKKITSFDLGEAVVPEVPFENFDGTVILFNKDYFNKSREDGKNSVGPFRNLSFGDQSLKVWDK